MRTTASLCLRGLLFFSAAANLIGGAAWIGGEFRTRPASAAISFASPGEVKRHLVSLGIPGPAIVAALKATILARDVAKDPGGTRVASRWRPIVREPPDAEKIREELSRNQAAELQSLIADLGESLRDSGPGYDLLAREQEARVRAVEARFGEKPPLAAESDYEKAITTVLGPLAKDFLRVRSPAARLLQSWLTGIEIDPGTYEMLADKAMAVSRSLGKSAGSGSPAIDELVRTLHSRIGDDKFLRISANLDPGSASVDRFLPRTFPAPRRVALFFRVHAAMKDLRGARFILSRAEARTLYGEIIEAIGPMSPNLGEFDQSPLGKQLRRVAEL